MRYLFFIFFITIALFSCEKKTTDIKKAITFLNNGTHNGKFFSASVINAPKTLWKVKTKGQVIGSPVVANNTVFIGSEDKYLYAINATSGEIIWTFQTNGAVNSTPVVYNNKVLFLSYDGFFYCLNQTDGALLWKFKTGGEKKFMVKDYFNKAFEPDFWDFYLSSAVTKGDTVYFGSSDSNLYALNINDGGKIWQFKTEEGIHSSPAIFNSTVVVGSWDSNVYAIDANSGKEAWKFSTGKDFKDYIYLGVQASPSIDNGIVYIGSRDAKYYALDIVKGDTIWTNAKFEGSWMPSSAAISKENIYTGSSDAFNFYSIDKKTGKINYSTKTNAYTFSSPAIDSTMAYIGSANGRLFGIELQTGKVNWEFKTVGLKTDTLQIFDHEGKIILDKYTEHVKDIKDMPALSKFTQNLFINSGSILSSPVIANQIIYFGSCDGYIYAITNK